MALKYVYVVGYRDNPVKIGHARDVEKRVRMMQTGSPDPLQVFHTLPIHHLAQRLEVAVHRELAAHRRAGEWFDVSAATAWEAITRLAPQVTSESTYVDDYRVKGVLGRLRADCPIPAEAEIYVHRYRVLMNDWRQKDLLERVNARIREESGIEGWTMFSKSVIEHQSVDYLFRNDWRAAQRAQKALASAVNSLCRM